MSRRWRLSAGTALALLLFMGFFDNFTQIPMISPYAVSLGASAVMAGWIVGIYSLTNMVGNIGAGIVLDRMGRRIPLVVGLIWAGLGLWAYGVVSTPWSLLLVRAFHGLGGSILVPAIFTLAADTLPENERSRGMGRIGAMIGIAAIVGPMYSGIVRQVWGANAVFTTVALIMAAGGLLALTLPETLRTEKEQKTRERGLGRVPYTAAPFKIASVSGFVIAFNLGALTLMLPLQMENLGFAASRSGSVFSLFGIVAVIVMLTAGRAGSRRGALAAGFVPVALAFTFLTVGSSFWTISLGMALYGMGFGVIYPSLNAQVATLYRVEERGRAYGIFYAFYSLGIVIAPPFVGWMSGFMSFHVIYALFASVAALGAAFLYHFRHLLAGAGAKTDPTPSATA